MERNKQADKAVKQTAAKSAEKEVISLTHVRRRGTEKCSAQKKRWLKEKLDKRSEKVQRVYRSADEIRQDSAVAAALKKIASQYYQMKMNHTAVGVFLQRRNTQISAECH